MNHVALLPQIDSSSVKLPLFYLVVVPEANHPITVFHFARFNQSDSVPFLGSPFCRAVIMHYHFLSSRHVADC
jgi:hypothetical protein